MITFRDQCIGLRNAGHSLPEIMKITGRPKTSIHYHIQHIPLTKEREEEWRRKSAARIIAIAQARKGKSLRSYKTFVQWSYDLVLLVAHLLFDGEIRRTECSYNNRNDALIARVESAMKHVYDYEPKRYYNSLTGVHRISYFNVALGTYMQDRASALIHEIPDMPVELKRAFLRAFFDDEGCMDFRQASNVRMVRGYQKNVDILFLVQKLLTDLHIRSCFKKPNEVAIVGKENLLKFQKEIDFSLGVRINGNRSNSIWRESLEKRDLLERAIASYKPIGSNGVHRH